MSSRNLVPLITLALGAAFSAPAQAQLEQPVVQIFTKVTGTVPDWTQMTLTVTRLELGGVDSVTRKRFQITAFTGSQQLVIPRSAAGTVRFVVSGVARAGRIDQLRLTLGSASVTTVSGGGAVPRVVPISVQDNALLLQPARTLLLALGQTRSLTFSIDFGGNAVLTQSGVISLRPTQPLAEMTVAPAPDNFLAGAEALEGPGIITRLPELALDLARAKAIDPGSGSVRDITVRKDNGAAVSFSELRGRNESLWRTRHGALGPALVQRLAGLGSTAIVRAEVWVNAPGPQTFIFRTDTSSTWDEAHATFVAERRSAAAARVQAVVDALTQAGAVVLGADLDPAVVHVEASRAVLESAVNRTEGVVEILEKATQRAVFASNASSDLIQQPLQFLHLFGVGHGLRIALLDDLPCVRTTHEAFAGIVFEERIGGCASIGDQHQSGHATAAAAALGSRVPASSSSNTSRPPEGLVGLFSGRIIQVDACSSLAPQVIERHPHVASSSCIDTLAGQGPDSEPRRDLDEAIFVHRVFHTRGSGNVNDGPLTGEYEDTAFCVSYNSLCVGSYEHMGTVGVGQFGDDAICVEGSSCPAGAPTTTWGGGWRNFENREKPDVVGPFSSRLPATIAIPSAPFENSWWVEWRGTSFGGPLIAGTGALLMANFQRELIGNPTLMRAVLMASASHGFVGFPRIPNINDTTDDRHGAGAPRGDRARVIVGDEHYFTRFVDRDTDFDAAGWLRSPIEFHVGENERARIVMSYDQCPTPMVSMGDVLNPDLDLVVLEPSVQAPAFAVHTNNSHVDNKEIIEFIAQRGTQVTVKVRAQFWEPCKDGTRRTHFAVAWDKLPAGPVVGP